MKIIGIIIGIILIPFIAALFLKKKYSVSKSVTINKSTSEVFNYLKFVKNHDNFVTWTQIDPNMKKSYRGTDGQIGFVSRWESEHKKVGVGEQEITAITENERIDFEMRFYEPFKAQDKSYLKLNKVSENETTVDWVFNGYMKYPMNLFLLFMSIEKEIGHEFQNSLNTLKQIMEK